MYALNQQIEYANGLQATVVAVYDDGHFIILGDEGYAACRYDLLCDDDEEVWAFVFDYDDDCTPWRDSLTDATCDVDLGMQRD